MGGRTRGISITGVVLVMAATFALPLGAAVATQLFPIGGAWGVTAVRLILASVFLMLLARPTPWRWTKTAWRDVVLFGITLAGLNGFFYAAVERIPLGVAVAIEFVGPLALAVFLSTNRRDLIWIGLAGLGLVVLGVESLAADVTFDLLGILFAALSGVSWAFYILFSARVGRQLAGLEGLPVATIVAALVLLPVGFSGMVDLALTPEIYWLALAMAVLSTVIPVSFEMAALRRLPRNAFSILLSLEPVFAALIGWVLLEQTFGVLRSVAIFLIIGATIGMTVSAARLSREVVDQHEVRARDERESGPG
ncbi:EamA family transporter [Enteractinococcus coprophilus]|uniref:Inner membrane transporter RhtA n=1 Tax=Enteractinococcus coprophilus TaxID=1027633 RepID=A0A543AGQ9_9MICC|nr:EamA family transporter [Enteractinococcus coprophilus]TQL71747.1 inner membrane transporter RhtA [Enteractinococcus coprophilus]